MINEIFKTAFPYLFLIIILKTCFLWRTELPVLKNEWGMGKSIRVVAALILTGGGMTALIYEGALPTQNIAEKVFLIVSTVLLMICISLLFLQMKQIHGCLLVGALLFGLFSATGNQNIFDFSGWSGWCCSVAGWGFFFWCALECCLQISNCVMFFENEKTDWLRYGMITFVLSVTVDLFFLLTFYPGVMNYDAFVQMCQVNGGYAYSNHHPWLHTMLIKGIWEIGQALFHSANKAFALYSICSLFGLSAAFACVVSYLRKKGLKTIFSILLILAYTFSPINEMLSISMVKDVPFAICIILFMVLLCIMLDRKREKRSNSRYWLLFIPVSFGVCFFRSNGIYVFLGMIPFVTYCFWKEKKKALFSIAVVLIAGVIYKGPVLTHFQVESPDTIESLAIPAQQIAAVFYYEGNITDEQIELLNHIVDTDKLGNAWYGSPGCVDDVKRLIREKDNQVYIREHKKEFIRLYLDMFMANKRLYVKAFVDETYGYWYHRVTFPSLWATYIEDNGMGICRDSKVPDVVEKIVREYLDKFKSLFDSFFSIGLIIYTFFTGFWISIQKRNPYTLIFLPALGIWCTLLLATPVYADIRYAYAIYNAVPMLVCLSMMKENTILTKKNI